jgi:hypothetical protein
MSLSVFVGDCVMLNLTSSKKRKFYKRMKQLDLKNTPTIADGVSQGLVQALAAAKL